MIDAVSRKMEQFIQNNGRPGKLFLFIEMTKAITPTPPLETPSLNKRPTPVPRKIEPIIRSIHRFLTGIFINCWTMYMDPDVTVMATIVQSVLRLPKYLTATINIEKFTIQSEKPIFKWNQWFNITANPPAPPEGTECGNKNNPIPIPCIQPPAKTNPFFFKKLFMRIILPD
jgi:hypothetical protein